MGEPPGWPTFCAFRASHPYRVPTQAAANLEEMDGQGLEQYAEVLAMENPDLYKWLTGKAPVPDEVWPAASVSSSALCAALAHQRSPWAAAD